MTPIAYAGISGAVAIAALFVATCAARPPATRTSNMASSPTTAAGSPCGLELVAVEKTAAAPTSGAWPATTNGGWMVWSDYRDANGWGAALPTACARRRGSAAADLCLGPSQGPTAVLADGDTALVARLDRASRVILHAIDDVAAREVATFGESAFDPMLARSGELEAVAWTQDRNSPALTIATRLRGGTFSAPLTVNESPYAIRARITAVPGGFVLAWTQFTRDLWFARVGVDRRGVPSIAWRFRTDAPGAGEWPSIVVEELGELTLVGDVVHLPLLKATCGFCEADAHVHRVRLDGRELPRLELREAPFFAAIVSDTGIALASTNASTQQECIRQFTLDGVETNKRCAPFRSWPEAALDGDGYATFFLMHSTAAWVGDELHVASLDNHDGVAMPTLRVFGCR